MTFAIAKLIFEYLNESHMYKLFIYNFLIVVSNKQSIPPPTHHLLQMS